MPTASEIYQRAKATDAKIAQDQAQLLADQSEGSLEHQELYDTLRAYGGPVVEVDPDQVHAMIMTLDPDNPGKTITTGAFLSTVAPQQPGTGPAPGQPTGTGMPPAPPTDAGTTPAPPPPDTGTQPPPQPPTDTGATPPDQGTPDTGTPPPPTDTAPTDGGSPDTSTMPPDQPTDTGTMPAGAPRPSPRR